MHPLARLARPLAVLVVALAVAAGSVAPAQESGAHGASAALEELSWLAGHWRTAGSSAGEARVEEAWVEEAWVEELWTSPAGSLMLALNRQVRPGRRASFEYLRIEAGPEGLVYVASPGGGPSTRFPLANTGERSVRFENPEHDWPQVIEYRLDDAGVLHVRAAGLEEDSQEFALEMHRVP